ALLGEGVARYLAFNEVLTAIAAVIEVTAERGARDPKRFQRAGEKFSTLFGPIRVALAQIDEQSEEARSLVVPILESGATTMDLETFVRASVLVESLVRIVDRARD